MQRVGSNRNPALDKFGVGKHGFTVGNPQSGSPATTPGAELFDSWQEELCAVVEGVGIALDGAKCNQVFTAIQTMLRDQLATAFTSSGTSSAYTLTPSPALGALSANTRYRVKFHTANNGAVSTLAVSGLAAKSIKQLDGFGNKVAPVIVASQLADLEYDGVDFVILDPLPTVIRQIQSLTAGAPSGGTLPITYNGGTLDFRNGTQTNGVPIIGVVVPSNNITLPSGATLGLIANQQGRIVFLEAYNGGSPVLCVANLAGGLLLDETNLISPTTISASANAANVIYSASAVSANSTYRVVGFMDITQSVAGTWVAPTLVQGCGGQALSSLASLGYGQTWQNVTRAAGTTYYNTTGRPIILNANSNHGSTNTYTICTINGVAVYGFGDLGTGGACPYAWVIPAGASYILSASSGALIIISCQELR